MTTPLQVLILEDRVPDAELAAKQLERSGFAVDWQRVETLRDFRLRLTPNLNVILADYSLPGFTALDALKELQATGLDVPFIIVSGTIGDERAVECLTEGVTDYVLKDRIARLGPAVQRALKERASRAQAKRTQQALLHSENQMRGILSTIEDVVWSMSLVTGQLLYVNPAAEKLTGRAAEEFLKDPQLWLGHVHPEDYAKMKDAQEKAVRWGTYESEYRMVRTDGTIRNVAIRAWAAYDAQEKPARLEGIFTDVTEKRNAERERIQSELNRREAERQTQLSEFKSRFIDMVAHDLNNVLTPMNLNVSLLGSELTTAGAADSKPLERLKHSVARLADFLADLLDASRMQSDHLSMVAKDFDVAACLRIVLDNYAQQAQEQGIRLDTRLPAAATLRGDARRIEQLVTNLLSNALKFTPPGGYIMVELSQSSKGAEIAVSDSGQGIAPEDIGKLFQPFTRVGSVPQGKHTGTGLGLFICRGIVERHGGTIDCHSEGLGKGTTFTVRLPTLKEAELAVPA